MKTILFSCLGLFILLFISCEKEKETLFDTQLTLSADTIYLNENDIKSLYLSTFPPTECKFQITSFPEWIDISPLSGSILNSIEEIQICTNFKENTPGLFEGKIEILSTLGNKTIIVKGTVDEVLSYLMPQTISISATNNQSTFFIRNKGNVSIDYQIKHSNDYISVPDKSGTIPAGQQQNILVNATREKMKTGTYFSEIYVTIGEKTDTLGVYIDHYKEEKIKLSTDIIDAEYSRTNDILVYVSSTPAAINIFNPSTETIKSIPLNYVPTCLSISANGQTAIVGHDAHISYIDLINYQIIKTHSVSCRAMDIILGPNKWAYVFPKTDQWENIRCVNLNLDTDNETFHTGNSIHAGTKAKLHPSGKYIYGANNGISPSDIEKYDIQNGTAAYVYDSPYHGDYRMQGDLWLSADGNRIFTKGGTVLKTSELPEYDMKYNGTISLNNEGYYAPFINWLDHCPVTDNLYILFSTDFWTQKNESRVYVYNASNLTYKNEINLEKYIVSDSNNNTKSYEAEPFFVFSHSSGNYILVLTKATGAGLVHEWSIQKIAL